MTFGGLGGPGATPGPFHGELARSEVARARAGVPQLPDDVIAAAREERAHCAGCGVGVDPVARGSGRIR